jgi:hypothetical protein
MKNMLGDGKKSTNGSHKRSGTMNAPYESATHFKKGSVARRTEAGTAQRI